MSNIQQQLQDLENAKLVLLNKIKEDKLNNEFKKAKEYEGKVYFKATETNRKKYLTYTWYKEAIIEKPYSNSEATVYIKTSEINVIYDLSYETKLSYKDKNKYEFNSMFHNSRIHGWTESNVDKFKELVKLSKSFVKLVYSETLENDKPIYEGLSGIEYDEEVGVDRTVHLLDIPHIILTKEQRSFIGNNVFLRGNIYIITKASLDYAMKKLKIDLNKEYGYKTAMSDFGYNVKNDKSKEIYEFRQLIKSYARKQNFTEVS